MEKLDLEYAIEMELEVIGALQTQKENIENEYQLKKSTLDIYKENKSSELKKGNRKRGIIAGAVGALTFIFFVEIMPIIANYIVSLPNVNTSSWMYDFIKSFSAEGVGVYRQALLMISEAFYSLTVGCVSGLYLEDRAKKKVQKKLGNFDETAYTEIQELKEMKSKIETELSYHKNELIWYRNNLKTVTAYDEKLDPGMIQYNTYSNPNTEMDIAKNPYTK